MSSSINHSIQVEGGLISGVNGERSDVIIFKGVPYAAPPVGDLRWCPPKPVIPWEGVRKCDTFGKICPQPFQPEEGFYRKEFYDEPDPETSEDCLYLNIWLPKSQLQNIFMEVHLIMDGDMKKNLTAKPLIHTKQSLFQSIIVSIFLVSYHISSIC